MRPSEAASNDQLTAADGRHKTSSRRLGRRRCRAFDRAQPHEDYSFASGGRLCICHGGQPGSAAANEPSTVRLLSSAPSDVGIGNIDQLRHVPAAHSVIGDGERGPNALPTEVHRTSLVPRFFIDTSDQARFIRDEDGIELQDVEAAMNAAADGLCDMARDALPGGESRTFIAIVRNEHGRTLVQTSMSFGVVWMPGGR